jgi:hypothetical protein
MKKLTILLFSILISFSSYGEWTEVVESVHGDTAYIDTSTIKEHGGYVYFWDLTDYLKPSIHGAMSAMSYKMYWQGDCGVNRNKDLSGISYKQPMGGGSGETYNPPNPEWRYPSPNSVGGRTLDFVCKYVK